MAAPTGVLHTLECVMPISSIHSSAVNRATWYYTAVDDASTVYTFGGYVFAEINMYGTHATEQISRCLYWS